MGGKKGEEGIGRLVFVFHIRLSLSQRQDIRIEVRFNR